MAIEFLGPVKSKAENRRGIRTYWTEYRLHDPDGLASEYEIGSHPSLPFIAQIHPRDPDAYCDSLSVDQTSPKNGWTVTATWTTAREGQTQDPTNDTARITWGGEQFQTVLTSDVNGEAILNSAGEPFDPPLMRDNSRPTVTIEKNVTSVPSWILSYRDKVNSSSFTVDGVAIAARVAKMQSVAVSPRELRNGSSYRVLTFTMHFNADTWDFEVLDAGYNYRNDDNKLQPCKLPGTQTDSTVPQLLDGSGKQIADPTGTAAQFLTFQGYETADFSILPLT